MAEGETLGSFLKATVREHLEDDGLTLAESQAGTLYLRHVDVAPGTELRVHLPAQDLILSTGSRGGLSTLNHLSGVVTGLADRGQAVDVTVDCSGAAVLARITRRSARGLELEVGKPVSVLFKALAIAPDSLYREA